MKYAHFDFDDEGVELGETIWIQNVDQNDETVLKGLLNKEVVVHWPRQSSNTRSRGKKGTDGAVAGAASASITSTGTASGFYKATLIALNGIKLHYLQILVNLGQIHDDCL